MKFLLNIVHYICVPFIFIGLCFNFLSINSKAKKYRKTPSKILLADRCKIVYKTIKKILFIFNINTEIDGFKDIAKKPLLFIINHKSALDPLIIFKIIYEVGGLNPPTFVAKKELSKSKLMANAMFLIDCVIIQRDNLRSVFDGFLKQDKLSKDGRSICIFPEGTRVCTKEFGEFLPASLKVAYQNFLTIMPITIYGSLGLIDRKVKNENKNKTVYIQALKPIQAKSYINIKQENLIDTFKDEMFKTYLKLEKMSQNYQKFPKE